ncbi:hypothetical protein [Bacillus sp. 3255]|uniref:hypothetical protein n=1 Tax=Bacillus sp. 3255 TaxID=2817904 RepID=UPI00286B157E|nr:hypothetical protein [Bacillus sp. 3255]
MAILKQRWQEFSKAKEQNVRWMLNGEYEKARSGLVNAGRLGFKSTMDLVNEWMEEAVAEGGNSR